MGVAWKAGTRTKLRPQFRLLKIETTCKTSSGAPTKGANARTRRRRPYSKINSVLNVGTSYTDNSVQAGQTYYYVTTSVAGSGTQSKYSNKVRVVIPNP